MTDNVIEIPGFTTEELAHLFIDTTDTLRDRNIERMFNTLYHGEPLDEVFRTSFDFYFKVLVNDEAIDMPEEVYTSVPHAKGLASMFGLLHVRRAKPQELIDDPDLQHCTHRAMLRSTLAASSGDFDPCFAPSELHAVLLTVVNTYRQLAGRWIESKLKQAA